MCNRPVAISGFREWSERIVLHHKVLALQLLKLPLRSLPRKAREHLQGGEDPKSVTLFPSCSSYTDSRTVFFCRWNQIKITMNGTRSKKGQRNATKKYTHWLARRRLVYSLPWWWWEVYGLIAAIWASGLFFFCFPKCCLAKPFHIFSSLTSPKICYI